MKQSKKELGKNIARFILINAAHKGPALLYKNRKRLLKTSSKAMRLSPFLLVGSKILIKYLERKKIL